MKNHHLIFTKSLSLKIPYRKSYGIFAFSDVIKFLAKVMSVPFRRQGQASFEKNLHAFASLGLYFFQKPCLRGTLIEKSQKLITSKKDINI